MIYYMLLGIAMFKKKSSTASSSHSLDLDHLYRNYSGVVYRRALRFLKNESEAEECVHEVFLKVIDKADQFKGQSSPVTWLYQITTRHCLTRIRDQHRRSQLLNLYVKPWNASSYEEDLESKEILDKVQDLLDEELKQICMYYYVDGLTHEEIGRILNCSGRTIGNRLTEIRDRLKGLYEESL